MFVRFSAMVLTVLLFVVPVQADNIFLNRLDLYGNVPRTATAVLTPDVQIWAFNTNDPATLEIEVGRMWCVQKTSKTYLYLGAYGAVWPDSNKYFLLPAVAVERKLGARSRFITDWAVYLPLNGGPWILFDNETAILHRVSGRTEVGIATGYFGEFGQQAPIRVGPVVKTMIGTTNVSLRYFFGEGGNNAVRLQIAQPF